MRKIAVSLIAALLVIASGCQNRNAATPAGANPTPAASSSTTSLSPEQLGNLGAQIKKQPNDAHALLTQHGLTEESFAAAVRKVSENPADAKRYATAYRSAS
jgi:hypothetical protein